MHPAPGRAQRAMSVIVAAVFAVALAAPASAAGFYVREQSTSALGTAFAGAASRGDDPSHLFYNPATIIANAPASATLDGRVFAPDVSIGAASAIGPLGPVVGVPGTGDMADTALAPSLFFSRALSETVSIGLGLSSPFAAVIESNPAWIGRFHLLKTDMRSYNVNPVIAWRLGGMVTVGAGLQVQYFKADLRNGQLFPTGAVPPFVEATGYLRGSDVGFGITAGVLVEPGPDTRVGLGYRSRIEHDIGGTAGLLIPGTAQPVHFAITTPDIVTASVSHRVSDALTLHGTLEWANWSLFDAIVVRFDSGLMPPDVRPQGWHDTWSGFAGAMWTLDADTSVSAGAGYTQAASTGGGSAISPDGDRVTVALGASRRYGNMVVKAGYAHIFFDDAALALASPTAGTLSATGRLDLDIASLSVTMEW